MVMVARQKRRPPLDLAAPLAPGGVVVSTIDHEGARFHRTIVCTRWITGDTDLRELVKDAALHRLAPGDLVAISEKVVVVATGRGVPASAVRPGRLARFLADRVRPVGSSRGLSIPEKVQLVIDTVGRPRIVLATLVAGFTRPLGIHGAFYAVAGYVARSMDGMRPPYTDVLLPPLTPTAAHAVADELVGDLGHPVAIVDMNDRGGSVRAVAGARTSKRLLSALLADNPMGQRDRATPIVIIRPDPG